MIGLDVMRGAAGVSASMKQRTWQHEHAEDWAGALEVIFRSCLLTNHSTVHELMNPRYSSSMPTKRCDLVGFEKTKGTIFVFVSCWLGSRVCVYIYISISLPRFSSIVVVIPPWLPSLSGVFCR